MQLTQKKLTVKQRKWMKEYIETGNATEAAIRVYSCKNRNVANAIGSQNLAKLSIHELMEESGLTDVALLRLLTMGLTKPSTKILKKQLTYKEGQKEVQEIEYEDVPDYNTRVKYLDIAMRLKGLLSSTVNTFFQNTTTLKVKTINYSNLSRN